MSDVLFMCLRHSVFIMLIAILLQGDTDVNESEGDFN